MNAARSVILSGVFVCVLLLPRPSERAVAQPGTVVFEAVPGAAYREFVEGPKLPIHGHSLVAVTLKPTHADLQQDTLHIYFHAAYRGRIRLDLTTADGSLRGEGTFQGTAPARTWARISIQVPRNAAVLAARSRSGPDTLTVAARPSVDGVPHVTAWGGPPAGTAIVRLYVNGRRGDMFVRLGTKPLVACGRIAGMTLSRFDHVCDFPLRDLPTDRKITLVRRDGLEQDPMPLTIP